MWFRKRDTSPKYLIAGLGNPGEEYSGTRHNAGFQVLDELLLQKGDDAFAPGRYASVAALKEKGKKLLLIKPFTYMNLSGKAVSYWLKKENIPLENLLVVCDDIALPFGTLRMRAKGGAGGHNGLDHINLTLGTDAYARLRFGVGSDFPKGAQADYVLSPWSAEEEQQLPARLKLAGEMVLSFALAGVERTMSDFNSR